ncbi:MAG: hypothetical protein BWY75_03531 [bacterium ADurb.Bin425]|nr:MAG: hypothetical protein BWY75_03531 [bacterium ADurb.Bin425]
MDGFAKIANNRVDFNGIYPLHSCLLDGKSRIVTRT